MKCWWIEDSEDCSCSVVWWDGSGHLCMFIKSHIWTTYSVNSVWIIMGKLFTLSLTHSDHVLLHQQQGGVTVSSVADWSQAATGVLQGQRRTLAVRLAVVELKGILGAIAERERNRISPSAHTDGRMCLNKCVTGSKCYSLRAAAAEVWIVTVGHVRQTAVTCRQTHTQHVL